MSRESEEEIIFLLAKNAASEEFLGEVSEYCNVNIPTIKQWLKGIQPPTRVHLLLLGGLMRKKGMLEPIKIMPGDIAAAAQYLIGSQKLTLDEFCELVSANRKRVLEWIFTDTDGPQGFDKLKMESALWEKQLAQPTFPYRLTNQLTLLVWAIYKKTATPDEITKSCGIELKTFRRWLFQSLGQPVGETITKIDYLLQTKRFPPLPGLDKWESFQGHPITASSKRYNDFAQLLAQVNDISRQLLEGDDEIRNALRREHRQLIFDTSNALAALCSETIRKRKEY